MIRRSLSKLSFSGNGVIAIRREDKNVWERRTPLTPKNVAELLSKKAVSEVLVQPSTTRCFTDAEFAEVGATVSEDLSRAGTVCAVKEVPAQLLLPDRTYMFFSHTIKAQAYNMPLLDTIVNKNIRLIDYERIVGPDGRLVKFGPYAGFAGMMDTLHAFGQALLMRGFATPFLHLSLSKEYRSLEMARNDLLRTGELIRQKGLPTEMGPLVFAVTGAGSVSLAAQQMLHLLPCKYIEVEDLPKLWARETKDSQHIYVVVVRAKDMVAPKDSSKRFDAKDYYANPQNYYPVFHERVAPYAQVLITGHYWEPRFPRLLTTAQAQELSHQNRFPLMCLGDITCDPGGSIEFFVKSTTIQNPLYVYNVEKEKVIDINNFDGTGVVVLGVDHLPAEFPCEASTDFASGLTPLMKNVANSSDDVPLATQKESLGDSVFNAVVTNRGGLTPHYEYITELRKANETADDRENKRVLVIGGGMTAGPCVRQLLKKPDTQVTVIDTAQKSLDTLVSRFAADAQGNAIRTEVANAAKVDDFLESQIKQSDVVVSLLPAPMHPVIAKSTIKHSVPLVTASYVSPGMAELEQEAVDAKTIVVNELGLDPGIDIMTSAKIINDIRTQGGVITKYVSLCGALPQPENSDGPLGYKFSWYPRGVLTAASRPTRFRVGGKWYNVPGSFLYHLARPISSFRGLDLHWVPNGNAEKYAGCYDLPDNETDTVVRGTLRFATYAPVVRAFQYMDILNEEESLSELRTDIPSVMSWPTLLRRRLGVADDANLLEELSRFLSARIKRSREELKNLDAYQALVESAPMGPTTVAEPLVEAEVTNVLQTLKQLGMLDEAEMVPKTDGGVLLDSLCQTMLRKMEYLAHERDFVLMLHRITAFFPQTNTTKTFVATLAKRGDTDTDTATANTVGLPVALTAQLVLDGHLRKKSGLLIPTDPEIYTPVLKELSKLGIEMHEHVE